MMGVIKALAAIIVLAILAGTALYVKEVKAQVAVPQLEILQEEVVKGVEPGGLAFERAVERLALGKYEEAEEKLQFVVNFDPGSDAATEARRILGEFHLDRYLSTEHMEGKKIHVVCSGDSFLEIAKQYETTIDCIVHLTGLMRNYPRRFHQPTTGRACSWRLGPQDQGLRMWIMSPWSLTVVASPCCPWILLL